MAKQRQMKMQMRMGTLAAIPELESRTDEQLMGESKHRAAAKAVLGSRAAEKYDAATARAYFNEAMAACHPQERPALRNFMKAALAHAERRPDDLKEAMEKLGQEPPSNRQLFLLRVMGMIAPPPGASFVRRARGILILITLVLLLLAIGFGLAKLIALPFGGVGVLGAIFLGVIVVTAILGVLAIFGRRRQAKALAKRQEQVAEQRARLKR
jgi:hypothetical protein